MMPLPATRLHRAALYAVGLCVLLPAAALSGATAHGSSSHPGPHGAELQSPIMFEANQGQSDPRVRLLAHGAGSTLFLTESEVVLRLQRPEGAPHTSMLRLKFVGASPQARLSGRDELRGKTNYLIGKDRTRWHLGVANYAAADYQALYPGVDAIFHGGTASDARQRLEFDFDVAAGADPGRIALQVEGARKLQIESDGEALLRLDGGRDVVLGKPRIYQLIAGRRREVAGEFVLRSRDVLAFALGAYDHSQRLIIDPTLEYSTYVLDGKVNGIAAGEISGHTYAYLVGTSSGGLAVSTGAFQGTCPACSFISSAFVAKYDTSQSGAASLIYSTYFGPAGPAGTMPDELGSAVGNAIAVDGNGDAYFTGGITGFTGSSYLPTPTAPGASQYLAEMAGTHAAYVAELDPTGEVLLASTYLGGNNSSGGGSNAGDRGLGIALDGSDNVYVTGLTDSPGLAYVPSGTAAQTTLNSGLFTDTPFVAQLNSTLSSLGYYTYLGGSNNANGIGDTVTAIAVDGAGEAYVVGGTYVGVAARAGVSAYTGSFPTPAAAGFQPSPGGSTQAGFLAKLNAGATQLLYLTYLGGGSDYYYQGTQLTALALNASGDAYVTGTTGEYNLPTTGSVVGAKSSVCMTATVTTCPGSLVAEFAPTSGSASLLFLSYLGGLAADPATTQATGIALDGSADIYIAGATSTSDMPEPGTVNTPNGSQPSSTLPCIALSLCYSPFLVELSPGATSVLYSGYLAGTGAAPASGENDGVAGLALDSAGNVYLAGTEGNNDFPTTVGGFDTTPPTSSGSGNSYLAQIGDLPSSASTPSVATFTLNGLPPTPVTPAGYTFDVSAPATTSVTVPVTLANTGGTALTLSGVSLFGSGSPPFTLSSLICNGTAIPVPIATPVSVGAGQSCTILLQFAPTVVQTGYTEGLAVLDNASSTNASSPAPGSTSGQFLLLLGTGTAAPPPAYASYSISGTVIVEPNFLIPAVTLSAGVDGTASTMLVLTNTGEENLTVSGMALSNASVSPIPWSITSVTCPTAAGIPTASSPATLMPGQSCSIGLQFAPTTLGVQDVALTVLDNASGSNLVEDAAATGQEFVLQGTAGQPYASIAPTQVDFGTVTETVGGIQGNGPAMQSVVVTNSGNAPLVITGVTIGQPVNNSNAFSAQNGCTGPGNVVMSFPVTLAPAASCSFAMQFAPNQTTGAQSATAYFIDNASESNIATAEEGLLSYTQELPLSGTGALPASPYPNFPYASFSAGVLSFDGSGVQTQPLTVTNLGGQPLMLENLSFAGASAFTLVPDGCSEGGTLAPFTVTLDTFQSCTLTFQFDPSVTGTTGPFYLQNGGPDAGATVTLNTTYSNIGVTDNPQIELLAPGASVACMQSTGENLNIVASQSSWEYNLRSHLWAQTISISNAYPGYTLPEFVYIVLEGLNTSLQAPSVPSGYIPTAPPPECGDALGSPFIVLNTTVAGPPGGTSGPATTVGLTIEFAEVPGAPTAHPSYTLKVVAGVGNP